MTFLKIGGHSMAAGFSIKAENLELLRDKLNLNLKKPKRILLKK